MSSGKRKGDSEDLPPGKKVRGVKAATFDKWISDNDAELTTSAWLIYDRQKNDRLLAECLKCSVCIKFVDRVRSCKNFSEAFITGSKNLRTSAFKDHAGTEMHKRGMNLFRRQECPARSALEFGQIAKALCEMDDGAAAIARRKFELTYLLCKEHIAFAKFLTATLSCTYICRQ